MQSFSSVRVTLAIQMQTKLGQFTSGPENNTRGFIIIKYKQPEKPRQHHVLMLAQVLDHTALMALSQSQHSSVHHCKSLAAPKQVALSPHRYVDRQHSSSRNSVFPRPKLMCSQQNVHSKHSYNDLMFFHNTGASKSFFFFSSFQYFCEKYGIQEL